jgi:hypothetical protein
MAVSTKRLLVNTVDKEDAVYYGNSIYRWYAIIKGPNNGLFIKVEAKSEKGTGSQKSDKLPKVLVIILCSF